MAPMMIASCLRLPHSLMACLAGLLLLASQGAAQTPKPIKVFILTGDEHCLENAVIEGRTSGNHDDFYVHGKRTKGEKRKQVTVLVFQSDARVLSSGEQLDAEPVATAELEIGYQRTVRADPKKRGRVPVERTPFPKEAHQEGHTTVLAGYLSVKQAGQYELHPGEGESAFNVTRLEGGEVYRRDPGATEATVTPVELKPGKRYAFTTIFFKQPGHAFQVQLTDKPGALTTVVDQNPDFGFLRGKDGNWVSRDDVVLYDAHSIHNNTEAPAKPVAVGVIGSAGPEKSPRIGVDLMLSHKLGAAIDQPVMILRYATWHPTWFHRGSRDLSHDFRPPSSGGGSDLDGGFDVIHFNHGVWDATYRDPSSKYFSGHRTTSVEDFEKNLRTLVGKMKKTGATLIWASVTPVWEGEADRPNGDEDAYNQVAAKVMKEHGVIINDLNAETRRQGAGKSKNVHDVGNLTPKVTAAIEAALAERKHKTKPLPRVLFIGDSITGTYWTGVQKNLDGKAVVFKNPGNAEDTWNGLERIDEWLDLKRYLLNGQEYLELVDGVCKVMGDELERAYPDYAGQGVELAGLFWLHGEADSKWDSKAADYEKHLANLIRDLRRDLKAPKLPVVVAALSASGKMRELQQQVFDAQMAVGDAQKHPEFADNVISIDTRPMARSVDQSPGGRDRYKAHAGTYLEIGQAMAEAMLRLSEK